MIATPDKLYVLAWLSKKLVIFFTQYWLIQKYTKYIQYIK